MEEVDRFDFCNLPASARSNAYIDGPLPIGNNATISAPHMHAFALEAALPFVVPGSGQRVLDVGSGSGYLCVAFAKLLGEGGTVYGIEHIQSLVDFGRNNCNQHYSHLLAQGRIHFICEDGRKGFQSGAPYDIIHVGAAADKIPEPLIDQLKVGGVLIIPLGVGDNYQLMKTLKKMNDGSLKDISPYCSAVRFVPLTDAASQLK